MEVYRDTAYIGPYFPYNEKEDFYVHKHFENIGRAAGGFATPQSSLVASFNAAKDQAKTAVKHQFKTLLINTQLDESTKEVLEQIMSNSDDLSISQMQKEVGQILLDALPVSKMGTLMQKESAAFGIDFNTILNKKGIEAAEEFNKLIDQLNEAFKLVTNKDTGPLVAIQLSHFASSATFQDLGQALYQQIVEFRESNQYALLSQFQIQQMQHVFTEITSLSQMMIKGKSKNAKKGKGLAADALRVAIQNIFSTGFAEAVAADIKGLATAAATNTAKDTVKQLSSAIVGNQKYQLSYSDAHGDYTGTLKGDKPQSGKADIRLDNFSVSINRKINGANTAVDLDLSIGISNKFYKNARFPKIQKGSTSSFHSGSTGTIADALIMLFKAANINSDRTMYLAYNTLGHRDTFSQANEALRDAIKTRSIINLFSSRGGITETGQSDFASYMFINGQIVSVWDIIMEADTAVKFTITPEILFASQQEEFNERIVSMNDSIGKAKVQANLLLNKMFARGKVLM